MFTHRHLLLIISLLILLTTGCASPLDQPPTPSDGGLREGSGSRDDSRVNIVLESVEVDQLPYDILDGNTAQMQLLVFWSDGWQLDRYSSYFGNTAVTAHVGSVFDNLGSGYVGFYSDQVEDEVYVWIIAVDNDDNDMLVDAGAGVLLDEFGNHVEQWVERRIAQTTTHSNLVTIILSAMLDVLYSVIEQPDLIGQQAFLLLRDENWNEGTYTLHTADGGLTIRYRIEVTNTSTGPLTQPTAVPPIQNPPVVNPTATPIPRSTSSPRTSASLNGTIDTPRLNLRYRPTTDSYIVYRASQYDHVRVIGRNSASDWALIDAGVVGWVNADYIVIEGDLSRLPLITNPSQYPAPVMPLSYICPGANGPSFYIGIRFVVPYGDGPSGVFAEPGREPVVGHVPEGVGGRILGGPICAVAPNNRYLTWYYVETDNGLSGYMNESFAETSIKAIVPR